MNRLPTPSSSAVADVTALAGLDGWLTPPLQPVVAPQGAGRGRVRTISMTVGPTGPGLAPIYDLLSSDLDGQVLVFAGVADLGGAIWGEILATAARSCGAAAVLVDGAVRDRPDMTAIGLAVYAREQRIVGPSGRAHVVAIDAPVHIDGVRITREDTVAFDEVGCIRLQAAREWQLLDAARRYAEGEARLLEALQQGTPLREAYRFKKSVVDALQAELRHQASDADHGVPSDEHPREEQPREEVATGRGGAP